MIIARQFCQVAINMGTFQRYYWEVWQIVIKYMNTLHDHYLFLSGNSNIM